MRYLAGLLFSLLLCAFAAAACAASSPVPRELFAMEPGKAVELITQSIREEDPYAPAAAKELITLHSRAIGGEESHLAFLTGFVDNLSGFIGSDRMKARNTAEELLTIVVDSMGSYADSDAELRRDRALKVMKRVRGWMDEVGKDGAELLSAKRISAKIDAYFPSIARGLEKSGEAKGAPPPGNGEARAAAVLGPGESLDSSLVLIGIVSRGVVDKSPSVRKSSMEMAQRINKAIWLAYREGGTEPRKDAENILVAVKRLLGDTDPSIRLTAAKTAGALLDRRMTAGLIRLLNDSEESIRLAGLDSLKKISGKDYGLDENLWKRWETEGK
jgi:cytochrome c556